MKIKVNNEELQIIAQLLRSVVNDFEDQPDNESPYKWHERLLIKVIKYVLIPSFLKKLIQEKDNYKFTLKPFEAEAFTVAIARSQQWVQDPFATALIERLKNPNR